MGELYINIGQESWKAELQLFLRLEKQRKTRQNLIQPGAEFSKNLKII